MCLLYVGRYNVSVYAMQLSSGNTFAVSDGSFVLKVLECGDKNSQDDGNLDSPTCFNGGVCDYDGGSNFTCDCAVGFSGMKCEQLQTGSGDSTQAVALGASLGSLGFIILTVLSACLLRRQRSQMSTEFSAQLEQTRKDGLKSRELQRGWVKFIDKLGEGCFGEVWKGLLNNGVMPEYMVAAKIAKVKEGGRKLERTAAAESDLMEEALLMTQVEPHTNLVSMIGVITRGHPKALVLSFCEHGALSGMLKKRASNGPAFPLHVKHRFCAEIAAGMVSPRTCYVVCGVDCSAL